MKKRTINSKGIVAAAMAMTLTLTGCTGLAKTDISEDEDVATKDQESQDKDSKNKDKNDKKAPKGKDSEESEDEDEDSRDSTSFAGLNNLSESERIYNEFLNDELDGDTYSDYVKNDGVTGYDFYDYDNDGIEELVLFSEQYYNMAAFEIEDDEVVMSVSGGGTASRLSFHKVDGESWVCYSDYEHMGYEDYTFVKYKGYDNKVDSKHFYREDSDDNYDADATYSVDDEEVDWVTFNRSFNPLIETERLCGPDKTIWLSNENPEFKWNGKTYTFTTEYSDSTFHAIATLSDGEDEIETEFGNTAADDNVIAYAMITGGKAYVYAFDFNEYYGDTNLYVYDLNKKSLEEPELYDEDFCFGSGGNHALIYEPGAFSFDSICNLAGNGLVYKTYKVGRDGMPEPYYDDGFAYYSQYYDPATTLKDINCQELIYNSATGNYDSKDITIHSGSDLYLYRTDCESFVDFETEDCRIVRIFFTVRQEQITTSDGYTYTATISYINGTDATEEYIDGLPVGE